MTPTSPAPAVPKIASATDTPAPTADPSPSSDPVDSWETGHWFESRRPKTQHRNTHPWLGAEALRVPDTNAWKNHSKPTLARNDALNAITSQLGADRYVVQEELGRGGMGVVYRGHDRLLDRAIAYKVLPDQMRHVPDAVEELLFEARALARLCHPNILKVYDFGNAPSGFYLAIEFVDGMDLRTFVRRERPTEESLRGILTGLCNGLHYAHSQGVVHRDIKPTNVLVRHGDHQTKILDFGLASVIENRDTKNGEGVIGSPCYMAPEQVMGLATDARTDIYSLGVTLYELFTGQRPFTSGDFWDDHLHTVPALVDTVNPHLSAELADLIARCLEKHPDDRFQSVDALGQRLQAISFYSVPEALHQPATGFSTNTAPFDYDEIVVESITTTNAGRDWKFSWDQEDSRTDGTRPIRETRSPIAA
jgi:serine/threonine-protein kinase